MFSGPEFSESDADDDARTDARLFDGHRNSHLGRTQTTPVHLNTQRYDRLVLIRVFFFLFFFIKINNNANPDDIETAADLRQTRSRARARTHLHMRAL